MFSTLLQPPISVKQPVLIAMAFARFSGGTQESIGTVTQFEELGLVNQKVDEECQTKVESASRYRVRFSGMRPIHWSRILGNSGYGHRHSPC